MEIVTVIALGIFTLECLRVAMDGWSMLGTLDSRRIEPVE